MDPHLSGGFMCLFLFPGHSGDEGKGQCVNALIALLTPTEETDLKRIALILFIALTVGAIAGLLAWYAGKVNK